MDLTLYHYWRSSCSWRVRWGLEIKGLPYASAPVNLLEGRQLEEAYRRLNPMGQVPCLVVDGVALADSIAILEYLEEIAPEVPILPKDPLARAQARRLANLVASGIQPLQNLATMNKISPDRAVSVPWAIHWVNVGFAGLERALQETAGTYCVGDSLTLADLCLIPQCYNAERFQIDLSQTPTIEGIYRRARALPSCERAAPEAFEPG